MEPPLTLHHGRFWSPSRITFDGASVGLIKLEAPFRYLGVDLTLTLDWRHQYARAMTLLAELGEGLASSPAGKRLTIEMEESCVLSALLYPCC